MTGVRLFVAALLLVSALGDVGMLQAFHGRPLLAARTWAAQSLATKVIAALLLAHAAWEGR